MLALETDTNTWYWSQFPIPKPGFGRRLVHTSFMFHTEKFLYKGLKNGVKNHEKVSQLSDVYCCTALGDPEYKNKLVPCCLI